MTFEQLEEDLPNGLHDAQIRSIFRNFENGTVALKVRILVGLPDESADKRDEYRDGSITFTGIQLFVVESPEPSSAFLAPGSLSFSVSRSEANLFPVEIVGKLKRGMDMYSLFILEWQSHIHLAASGMSFGWDAARRASDENMN